ncbi:helicase-related protein [Paramicrobacterium agarici]|uniref:SNF2 domain-containing protein n=1 Tax=Paramicrobacterium agarici TaxID=630514 RepID=A0A2A9DTK7_9MICO|nr:helicase-related protein [Microbacterium agarici]PFG29924.1 SNF2 domain-containing protein [Microbacterium agarici]
MTNTALTASPKSQLNVAPGSTVIVRDAEWIVTSTEMTQDGMKVSVQGLSELVRDTSAVFYESLDTIAPLDPREARVVADTSAGYKRARLWLDATLRKGAIPLNEGKLTVSTRMLSDTLEYQRSAVLKALDPANLRPRILIADAVGLGKTIEIGMILSELVRRGRGDRTLIVTPKHVLEQMQHEMWTRFGLPFVRLDSVGIQRVRQQLPATRNPFSLYKRVIISIDTLKQEKYLAHLKKHRWDAVVIDESHNITGATQNNRLARILAENAEALLLASATPHNGKAESFAEMMRLLEPTAVTPNGEVIPSEVERLVIRRHRNSPEVRDEVGDDWAERMPLQNFRVDASPAENAVADELAEVWLHPDSGSSPYSGSVKGLFPWTLAKAFLSSPAALAESVSERIRRLGTELTSEQRRERDALEHLGELAQVSLQQPSAKYNRLVEYMRHVGISKSSSERIVVFSERVATLGWLRSNIMKDFGLAADQVEVLHGGLSDVEQQEIVESFKQSSSRIRVLITGDVASEGVNLHSQCHELVHFDIPWSLIRIEQRNGRIDRYGQRKRPQITTLLLTPSNDKFTGDVRVLKRLLEREEEAHQQLGDSGSLMGMYSAEAEEKAIMTVLDRGSDLDTVVPTVEKAFAATGDAIGALLANIAAASSETAVEKEEPYKGSGLFASDLDYLTTALSEVYSTPAANESHGGVSWREHREHGTAELTPPRDLAQRLKVLPQSYLTARNVTEHFALATTRQRASALLKDAVNSPDSTTIWPEAHYLGPLHPILDWMSDRALSELSRNEVFAVQTSVSHPTVLVQGSLTNRRGQVVALSFMTVAFPNPDNPSFALVETHGNARAAIEEMGLTTSLVNTGRPLDIGTAQRLVPVAYAKAESNIEEVVRSSREDITNRVSAWRDRVDEWKSDAATLTQIHSLRSRAHTVDQEREIAESMLPNQRLIRPLLVAMPADEEA